MSAGDFQKNRGPKVDQNNRNTQERMQLNGTENRWEKL